MQALSRYGIDDVVKRLRKCEFVRGSRFMSRSFRILVSGLLTFMLLLRAQH